MIRQRAFLRTVKSFNVTMQETQFTCNWNKLVLKSKYNVFPFYEDNFSRRESIMVCLMRVYTLCMGMRWTSVRSNLRIVAVYATNNDRVSLYLSDWLNSWPTQGIVIMGNWIVCDLGSTTNTRKLVRRAGITRGMAPQTSPWKDEWRCMSHISTLWSFTDC